MDNTREKPTVEIVLKNGAKLPLYATEGAVGADVRSIEDVTIFAGCRKLVHTGIYMKLPPNMEVQVRPRSGLAVRQGVEAVLGTIDSDYRGECCVLLVNNGDDNVFINAGDRIAQFVFVDNVTRVAFKEVENFDETTERGEKGFGSTGIK